jgi:hypothetical protein
VPGRLRASLRAGTLGATDQQAINAINVRLQQEQLRAAQSFISRTTVSHTRWGAEPPVVALRAVLANPLTTREDLLAVLAEQVQLGQQLEATAG